ncbi:M20/M25/M40 family peptidase [Pontibacillus halophilus JSM 076056 = DSM 19796]|uniref:M20/M25/M40 family peptidase n=1 Tax=Pontibacillus halophilus JSM 076056 = DSM 19796 TaxID=1385510 RepID=A0A0A5GRD2_9BACI|nr:dipeptidase [Pontibacillus halophilus]KGX93730.1 M20/M25/M40 family peptidase [Pontibacillus halophilus JSM 076056 = DSM 19796]
MSVSQYIQKHEERMVEELTSFLSIPSISSMPEHKEDVHKAAEWVAESLQSAGLEHVELVETEGHPIVYADWLHAEGKPTVLIYGHYDVQPAAPLDLWNSNPFQPEVRDGKLYARGATDDKGQLYLHIKAMEALFDERGELPVNVKFCIEGEEEIASPNLPPYIEQNEGKLGADAVVISDTSFIEPGLPALCTSLRGALALELSVKTANTDLHSGVYGGGVPNALHSLVRLLDSFHDETGQVAVEGFYQGVPEPTELLKEEVAQIPFNEEQTLKDLGLQSLYGEEGFTFQERTGIRPTLEINGMAGGHHEEGFKTIVPSEAHAKISCRLVGEQDPDEVYRQIEGHVRRYQPTGATANMKKLITAKPVSLDSSDPMIQKAADAYEEVYGTRPLFPKEGGSIPIVENFSRVLQAPVVLMGFGLPSENLHAPNEHFHLENFTKGIETVATYLKSLS